MFDFKQTPVMTAVIVSDEPDGGFGLRCGRNVRQGGRPHRGLHRPRGRPAYRVRARLPRHHTLCSQTRQGTAKPAELAKENMSFYCQKHCQKNYDIPDFVGKCGNARCRFLLDVSSSRSSYLAWSSGKVFVLTAETSLNLATATT